MPKYNVRLFRHVPCGLHASVVIEAPDAAAAERFAKTLDELDIDDWALQDVEDGDADDEIIVDDVEEADEDDEAQFSTERKD